MHVKNLYGFNLIVCACRDLDKNKRITVGVTFLNMFKDILFIYEIQRP